MLFEELSVVEAPSDGAFWGGVAIGTVVTVGVAWVICC
jgi:hypothetical protein